ncbi:hypothetical protein ACXGXA_25000, partial [Salmonella enterica subsp. enterica serovar Infantis]
PGGAVINGDFKNVMPVDLADPQQIQEFVDHAWYRYPDDRLGRPLMFYGQRIHDKCYRRAHFDAGEFVESWDDDAARKGYCL